MVPIRGNPWPFVNPQPTLSSTFDYLSEEQQKDQTQQQLEQQRLDANFAQQARRTQQPEYMQPGMVMFLNPQAQPPLQTAPRMISSQQANLGPINAGQQLRTNLEQELFLVQCSYDLLIRPRLMAQPNGSSSSSSLPIQPPSNPSLIQQQQQQQVGTSTSFLASGPRRTINVPSLTPAQQQQYLEQQHQQEQQQHQIAALEHQFRLQQQQEFQQQQQQQQQFRQLPFLTVGQRGAEMFAAAATRDKSAISVPTKHVSGTSSKKRTSPVPSSSGHKRRPRADDEASEYSSPGAGGGGGEERSGGDPEAAFGERRLTIDFSSLGTPGEYPQKFGRGSAIIPDGLAGQHTLYGEMWRFQVSHVPSTETLAGDQDVPAIRIRWVLTNVQSGRVIDRTETIFEAKKRVTRGKTIANQVVKAALEARASELEQLMNSEPDESKRQLLRSRVEALRPVRFTQGPLVFGLHHRVVHNKMAQDLANASAASSTTST